MSRYIKLLQERKEKGNFRQLNKKKELVDFVSNDYLGLSRSKELFENIQKYYYDDIVHLNGSTGSRLLAGNYSETEALETKLAEIFKGEAALLFNSGYVANLALISSLPQKDDTIIYDSLSHICIKEGALLSKAKTFSFQHNDCNDLEKKLKVSNGEKFIIIESVYSMDGDVAPFGDIISLAQKYNAKLIVDEAHSTGLYGKNGSGKLCSLGIEENIFARVYTFGKAMGVHGACIVGSKKMIDFLINFARPFIYTTALPIHSVFSIDAAFDFLAKNTLLQKVSKDKIFYFNSCFKSKIKGHSDIQKLESYSPIQPIIVPGNNRVKAIASTLQENGMDVRAILSPTVKEGAERLRISIHTHNSDDEIKSLVDTLSSLL
ncbi:MAG: pyridoxal phosphate-dependent aminotransferase family protein [Reichenbachiella sp.]